MSQKKRAVVRYPEAGDGTRTGSLLIVFALIAIAFTREARAEKSPALDVNIVLLAGFNLKVPTHWLLCTVNENYFTVPRSMLTREVTITATNGVAIHFPWQAHQCKPVEGLR